MITYLTHSGSDNSIANVARQSMGDQDNFNELPDQYTEVQRNKLLNYLAVHGHSSPFRHTSISLKFKIPIFLARQLGKHQVGLSWNELSRRYVKGDLEFFHPEWRAAPSKNIKQGSAEALPEEVQYMLDDVYQNVLDVAVGAYDNMLAEGVAPEQARMLLPQSLQTDVVWTGSLTAFAHVFNLRAEEHAQKEAQDFALALDKVISPLFPVAWDVLTGQ